MPPARFITLWLSCLCSLPAAAWQAQNRLQIDHGKLTIDRSKSIAEITRAQASGGFKATQGADIGLGLFQSRMTASVEIKPLTGDRLALSTRIQTTPVIYVAREFAEDSCAYKLILGHEWQHYLFDREALRHVHTELPRLTADAFNRDAPVTQANLENAKRSFMQRLTHTYDGFAFPLHARIDNPEAYAALSRQCNGEIGKQLGKPSAAQAPKNAVGTPGT